MAAAPAAAAPDALLIAHSDAENARMDAEMDGLGEPLLKWYKIVRYAHQPTFERKNGELRLVAHASALETYAPFWMIKAEGGDLFCTCDGHCSQTYPEEVQGRPNTQTLDAETY